MASWNGFIDEGIKNLSKAGLDFTRPSDETDKLYMSLGGSDVIEVTHPTDTSQFEYYFQDFFQHRSMIGMSI